MFCLFDKQVLGWIVHLAATPRFFDFFSFKVVGECWRSHQPIKLTYLLDLHWLHGIHKKKIIFYLLWLWNFSHNFYSLTIYLSELPIWPRCLRQTSEYHPAWSYIVQCSQSVCTICFQLLLFWFVVVIVVVYFFKYILELHCPLQGI